MKSVHIIIVIVGFIFLQIFSGNYCFSMGERRVSNTLKYTTSDSIPILDTLKSKSKLLNVVMKAANKLHTLDTLQLKSPTANKIKKKVLKKVKKETIGRVDDLVKGLVHKIERKYNRFKFWFMKGNIFLLSFFLLIGGGISVFAFAWAQPWVSILFFGGALIAFMLFIITRIAWAATKKWASDLL